MTGRLSTEKLLAGIRGQMVNKDCAAVLLCKRSAKLAVYMSIESLDPSPQSSRFCDPELDVHHVAHS